MSVDDTGGSNETESSQPPNDAPEGSSDRQLFGSGDTLKGLEQLRLRLLDLTNRNRLLNFRHPKRSSVRIIDELPDELYGHLINDEAFVFKPVPKPSDVEERIHQREVIEELGNDINPTNIPPLTAKEFAANLGLSTNYEMPTASNTEPGEGEDKHLDRHIQTLFFPIELEKSLSTVRNAAQLAIEESGSNFLHLAFGFVEWTDSDVSQEKRLAPLMLFPTTLERGPVDRDTGARTFKLAYSGEDLALNLSLRDKLCRWLMTAS